MRAVAMWPAAGLMAGAWGGSAWGLGPGMGVLWACVAVAWALWAGGYLRAALVAGLMGFMAGGAVLGARADQQARHPSLRQVLDDRFGGFALEPVVAAGAHAPVETWVRLTEDAAVTGTGLRFHGEARALNLDGRVVPVQGGVLVSIGGDTALSGAGAWRAGRTLRIPLTFRRPARYLDAGVPDGELEAARTGVALLARGKSGLLAAVVAPGSRLEEAAGAVRARVRARVERHMAGADPVRRGIVTALLIGDRSAIPDEVTAALRAAGTYHAIAISGGNVAVLVLLLTGAWRLAGAGPRLSAWLAVPGVLAYLLVVAGGPSVWRAGVMGLVYLLARAWDVRPVTWNTLGVSAACLTIADPLSVRSTAFALTFGASGALILLTAPGPDRVAVHGWRLARRWLGDAVLASAAVELVILPVMVEAFGRVTVAGVGANLVAVPAMAAAQVGGLLAVASDWVWPGRIGGAVADVAAGALVRVSVLAAGVPALSPYVPPPPAWVWVVHAAGVLAVSRARRPAWALIVMGVLAGGGLLAWRAWSPPWRPGLLALTAVDVGQGDGLLVRLPDGQSLLVDAGGEATGARVFTRALWAQGVRRLSGVLLTHGDPDHAGGISAALEAFRPAVLSTGIPVPGHPVLDAVDAAARRMSTRRETWLDGHVFEAGGAQVRVLAPPAPDWVRPGVRNDDSVVVEVVFGEVAVLLTGDAGVAVEQGLLPRLSKARIRVLKVGHHGSRTSTGDALVQAWRPDVAVISCGRGNAFGHPAPAVVRRLEAAGTRVFRTDRDGEVTLETDGQAVHVRTWRHPGPVRVVPET